MADPIVMTPKLDATGLSQVWSLILANFVSKQVLTDELITKLEQIESKAQVNVLEGLTVNGENATITNKKIALTIPTGALASKDKVGSADLDDTLAEALAKVGRTADGAEVNVLEGIIVGSTPAAIDSNKKVTLGAMAGKSNVAESDLVTELANKINAAQTSDQVQSAINTALSNVYKYKGSLDAISALPNGDEDHPRANGDMYNITAAFTTDATFMESGKDYPAGTNVAWNGTKWDCMAGTYDFSNFVERSELTAITAEKIAEICVMPTVGGSAE